MHHKGNNDSMNKIRRQFTALHANQHSSNPNPSAPQPWGELSTAPSEIGEPPRRRGVVRWAILVAVTLLAATTLSACFSLFPGMGQAVAPTATQVANIGPALTLDPGSGYAGAYVRVGGQGWPANTMVILALQDATGRSGILAASTSGTDGTVSTGFLYPISDRWLVPGPNTVIAYTADGNLQATTAFQVVRPGTAPITTTLTTTPSPTATAASGGAVISTPTATHTSAPANTPTPTQTNTSTPINTATATNTATPQPTALLFTDWRADYWANPDLSGPPALTRNDVAVSFDWALASPGAGLPADNFSARWSRSLNFDAGLYRFIFQVDDGVRFYIDDQLVLDEWRDGSFRTQTVERSLTQGIHTLRVDYYERTGKATIRFAWERQEIITGWKGEYYPNPDLLGVPVLVRDDAAIDFQWGINAPAPLLPADGFSVRWSRDVAFENGSYRFFLRADDGIRLWIDGVMVLDEWHDSTVTTYSADVDLGAGAHRLRVEYYENTLGARAEFWWQSIARPTPTWTATWTKTPPPSSTPTWVPFPTSTPTALPTAQTLGRTELPLGVQLFEDDVTTPALEHLREAGVAWARVRALWKLIEPRPGAYDWTVTDRLFGDAAASGFRMVAVVYANPDWVTEAECRPVPPEHMERYAALWQALVERYDGDGKDDAPEGTVLRYWQVSNEPDFDPRQAGGEGDYGGCFGDDPARYAAQLAAAYRAAKAADPAAQLGFGPVAWDRFTADSMPPGWTAPPGPYAHDFTQRALEALYRDQAGREELPFADFVGLHNYPDNAHYCCLLYTSPSPRD